MLETANSYISIYSEDTPNPQTMKFVVNKLLYPDKTADFTKKEDTAVSPLANALFRFPFVRGVFIASNFVTLTKAPNIEWKSITTPINLFLKEYLERGLPVISPPQTIPNSPKEKPKVGKNKDIISQIKEVLEVRVKPVIEMDGGAILYEDYQNGILTVTLHGACNGCPSSMKTLKNGVETIMKRLIPEVKEVRATK